MITAAVPSAKNQRSEPFRTQTRSVRGRDTRRAVALPKPNRATPQMRPEEQGPQIRPGTLRSSWSLPTQLPARTNEPASGATCNI